MKFDATGPLLLLLIVGYAAFVRAATYIQSRHARRRNP